MRPYNKNNVSTARALRNNMTPWERKLWYVFLSGYTPRFQRQKPIGSYIVDFYCAKARLVLELDGSQHCDPIRAEKDQERTLTMEKMGISVLRISNLDIDNDFSSVCRMIDRVVKMRLNMPSA